MTRLIFVFFCAGLLTIDLEGQAMMRDIQGNESFDIRENTNTDGNPYLFDDWVQADLIDVNGNRIKDVEVNYDGERNRFISKMENEKALVLNIWNYRAVELHNDNSTYVNITSKGEPCYCKVIYESDNFSCYEKFTATKKRSSTNSYSQVTAMYKYSSKVETLLFIEDELFKLKRKDKDIAKIFGNNEIKAFAKANKLDLKKDKDLAKLLEYADSL